MSESPSAAAGRSLSGLIFSTARSVSVSEPNRSASYAVDTLVPLFGSVVLTLTTSFVTV